MNKKNKNLNVFEQDVVIPKCVRDKANLAFANLPSKDTPNKVVPIRKKKKHHFVKFVAAAASIAVVVVSLNLYQKLHPETREVINNPFTIKVYACEVTEGVAAPVCVVGEGNMMSYGYDWQGDFDYEFILPISVEGENIKEVTYTIENANFQVVTKKDDPVVIRGERATGLFTRSFYEGGYNPCGEYIGETSVGYYQSFTMDYNKQTSEIFYINICNQFRNRFDLYNLFSAENTEVGCTIEQECAMYNYLLQDVKITCTVTFTDGSTGKQELALDVRPETKTDVTTDGYEYQYDMPTVYCLCESDKPEMSEELKQFVNQSINSHWIDTPADLAPYISYYELLNEDSTKIDNFDFQLVKDGEQKVKAVCNGISSEAFAYQESYHGMVTKIHDQYYILLACLDGNDYATTHLLKVSDGNVLTETDKITGDFSYQMSMGTDIQIMQRKDLLGTYIGFCRFMIEEDRFLQNENYWEVMYEAPNIQSVKNVPAEIDCEQGFIPMGNVFSVEGYSDEYIYVWVNEIGHAMIPYTYVENSDGSNTVFIGGEQESTYFERLPYRE